MEGDSRDLSHIVDDDILRKMWQQTEDFGRKKEIRSQMYKLREQRLKEFYTTGEVLRDVQRSSSQPKFRQESQQIVKITNQPTHADSLIDHSFMSLKSKEIRDSESPTRDVPYGTSTGGNWSSIIHEKSDDGKYKSTTKVDRSEGSKVIDSGIMNYASQNKSKSSVYTDADANNFQKAQSKSQHHESHQVSSTGSKFQTSSTQSSHSQMSSSEFHTSSNMAKNVEMIPESRVHSQSSTEYKITSNVKDDTSRNNQNLGSSQTCDITTEFEPTKGNVTKETKILADGTKVTTVKYESSTGGGKVTSSNFINEERRVEEDTRRISKTDSQNSTKVSTENYDTSTIKRRTTENKKNEINKERRISPEKSVPTTVKTTAEVKIVPKEETITVEVCSTPSKRESYKKETSYQKTSATDGQYDTTYRTDFTNKRISVEISPTHDAFARSLRSVSPERVDSQKSRSPPRKMSSSEKIRRSHDEFKTSSSFISQEKRSSEDSYGSLDRKSRSKVSPDNKKYSSMITIEDTDFKNRFDSSERRGSRKTSSPEDTKKHYSSPERPSKKSYDFIAMERSQLIKEQTQTPTEKSPPPEETNLEDSKVSRRRSFLTSSTISRQAYVDGVSKSKPSRESSPTKDIKRRSKTFDEVDQIDSKESTRVEEKTSTTSTKKRPKSGEVNFDSTTSSPTTFASDFEFVTPGVPVTDLDDNSDIEVISEDHKETTTSTKRQTCERVRKTAEEIKKNKTVEITKKDKTETAIGLEDQIVSNAETKKPLKEKPLFRRSETYKERCRKILGMPDPKPTSKEEPAISTTNLEDLYGNKEPVVEPPFVKKYVAPLGPDDEPDNKQDVKPTTKKSRKSPEKVATVKTEKVEQTTNLDSQIVKTEAETLRKTPERKESTPKPTQEDTIVKKTSGVEETQQVTKNESSPGRSTKQNRKPSSETEVIVSVTSEAQKVCTTNVDQASSEVQSVGIKVEEPIQKTHNFVQEVQITTEKEMRSPKKSKKRSSIERVTQDFIHNKSVEVQTQKDQVDHISSQVTEKNVPLGDIEIVLEISDKPEEVVEVQKMREVFENKIKVHETSARKSKSPKPKEKEPTPSKPSEPEEEQLPKKREPTPTKKSSEISQTVVTTKKIIIDSTNEGNLNEELTSTDEKFNANKKTRKSPTKDTKVTDKSQEITKKSRLEEKTASLKREVLNEKRNQDIIFAVEQLINTEKGTPKALVGEPQTPKPKEIMNVEEIKITVEEPKTIPMTKRVSQEHFEEIQLEIVPTNTIVEVTTIKETKRTKDVKPKRTLVEKEKKVIRPENEPTEPKIRVKKEEKASSIKTTTKKTISKVIHLQKNNKQNENSKNQINIIEVKTPKTPTKIRSQTPSRETLSTKRVEKIIHLDSSPKKTTPGSKGSMTPRRLFTNGVDLQKETPNFPYKPIHIATLTSDKKLIPKTTQPKVCLKHTKMEPIKKPEQIKRPEVRKHVVTKTISLSRPRGESPKPTEERKTPIHKPEAPKVDRIRSTPIRAESPKPVAKTPSNKSMTPKKTTTAPIKSPTKQKPIKVETSGKIEKVVIESTKSFKEPNKPQIVIQSTLEYEGDLYDKSKVPKINITSKSVEMLQEIPSINNVIVDLYRSKSSRESSPEKVWPVPVSPDEETGRPRYPDQISEPDDIPIKKKKPSKIVPLNEAEVLEEFEKITELMSEADESLLSVTEKVNKFSTQEEKMVDRPKSPAPKVSRPDFEVTEELKEDDCILSVSQKVSKFLNSAEKVSSKKEQSPIKPKEKQLFPETIVVTKDTMKDTTDFIAMEINAFIKERSPTPEKGKLPEQKVKESSPKREPKRTRESSPKKTKPERERSPKKISKETDITKPKQEVTPEFSRRHSKELQRKESKPEITIPQENGISQKTQKYLAKTEMEKETNSEKRLLTLKSCEAVRKAKQMFENTSQKVDMNVVNRPSIWEGRKMTKKSEDKVKLTDLGVKETKPTLTENNVTLKSTKLILQETDGDIKVENCPKDVPGYMKPLERHDHKSPEPETKTKIIPKEPETITKLRSPSPEKLLAEITSCSKVKQLIAERITPKTKVTKQKSPSPERKTPVISEGVEISSYMKPVRKTSDNNNKYIKEITRYERREKSPSPERNMESPISPGSPRRYTYREIINTSTEVTKGEAPYYMKPLQRRPSENLKEEYIETRQKSPERRTSDLFNKTTFEKEEITSSFTKNETPIYMKPLQRKPSDHLKEKLSKFEAQTTPEQVEKVRTTTETMTKITSEVPSYMKPLQRKPSDHENVGSPERKPSIPSDNLKEKLTKFEVRQKSPERMDSEVPSYMKPLQRRPSDHEKTVLQERKGSITLENLKEKLNKFDVKQEYQERFETSTRVSSEIPSYMRPLQRRPSDQEKVSSPERKSSIPSDNVKGKLTKFEPKEPSPKRMPTDQTPSYMKPLQRRSTSKEKSTSPERRMSRTSPEKQVPSYEKKNSLEPMENDDTPRGAKKFGVKLRRTDSGRNVLVNSTATTVTTERRRSTTTPGQPVIEDIQDLELLEQMMEKAVGYEQRRRIRSQIRIVRRLITEKKIPEKKFSSQTTRSSTRESHQTIVKKLSSKKLKDSPESPVNHELVSKRFLTGDRMVGRFEKKNSQTKIGTFETVDTKRVVKTKRIQSRTVVSEEQKFGTFKKSSPMFKQEDISKQEIGKSTDLVTSSYGVGPTDENGLPLFGLRALRKAGRDKVHVSGTVISSSLYSGSGKEPVGHVTVTEYSNRDGNASPEGIVSVTTTQKFGKEGCPTLEEITTKKTSLADLKTKEDEPVRSKLNRRGSVKALSQKFIENAVDTVRSETASARQSYPKAGLILRTGSFGDSSASEAFIQHESTEVYREVDMLENGERRTSLKKSVESPSSASLVLRAQRQTSKESGETKKELVTSTKKFHAPVTVETTEILDEHALRLLLQQCTDYEERKVIREKLKQIMADQEARMETTKKTEQIIEGNKTITKVSTTHSNLTRSSSLQTSNKPMSPFAKFLQLDKQNSLNTPPSSPRFGGGGGGGPLFKFTDPQLSQSAATIKDRLLQWCQNKTRDYQNIKLDNFSTSWADGLAFCALIHHFLPDAFDYHVLSPKHRRHNFTLAFKVADEQADIAPLLDVDDMVAMRKPDWKCVFTYVQSIYRRFKDED